MAEYQEIRSTYVRVHILATETALEHLIDRSSRIWITIFDVVLFLHPFTDRNVPLHQCGALLVRERFLKIAFQRFKVDDG